MKHILHSIGAVVAGLVTIVVTHTGADFVMHTTGVFPPYGEPMTDSGQYAIALLYRIVFSVFGCWVAGRLAPRNPMRHALALGVIGVVLTIAGAIIMWGIGPNWYPIALALSALPAAWAGGRLAERTGGKLR